MATAPQLRSLSPLSISRRGALHAGVLGLGGLNLANLLQERAVADLTLPKDTSVIFLFLHGGPSQLETYDLKPQATSEVRGPCMPIATKVPGLDLCELLPLHAKAAERFTLIRSCTHGEGGHFEAHGRFMSGHPGLKTGTFESTHPQMGAIVGRALKSRVRGLPAAVGMSSTIVLLASTFRELVRAIGAAPGDLPL